MFTAHIYTSNYIVFTRVSCIFLMFIFTFSSLFMLEGNLKKMFSAEKEGEKGTF